MARNKIRFDFFQMCNLVGFSSINELYKELSMWKGKEFPGLKKIKKIKQSELRTKLKKLRSKYGANKLLVKMSLIGKVNTELKFFFYYLKPLENIDDNGVVQLVETITFD